MSEELTPEETRLIIALKAYRRGQITREEWAAKVEEILPDETERSKYYASISDT